jgi:DNA replication protein DnaC
MQTGIVRIQYMPYKMNFALTVVERIAKGLNPFFSMSVSQEKVFKELIRYIHGDPEFDGDLNKGILLMGPTGTGKTLAMLVMSIYRQIDNTMMVVNGRSKSMHFEIVKSSKIVNDYACEGSEGIEIYLKRLILCIDDIGSEPRTAANYGNKVDVIEQILTERYERRSMTLGTTNLTEERLSERYDNRVISRMYKLFNFIVLNDKDYRIS